MMCTGWIVGKPLLLHVGGGGGGGGGGGRVLDTSFAARDLLLLLPGSGLDVRLDQG